MKMDCAACGLRLPRNQMIVVPGIQFKDQEGESKSIRVCPICVALLDEEHRKKYEIKKPNG